MTTLIYAALLVLTCGFAGLALAAAEDPRNAAPAAAPARNAAPLRFAQTCPECQRRYLDRARICQANFESPGAVATYHNLAAQRTCIDNARSEYDACRAICRN